MECWRGIRPTQTTTRWFSTTPSIITFETATDSKKARDQTPACEFQLVEGRCEDVLFQEEKYERQNIEEIRVSRLY